MPAIRYIILCTACQKLSEVSRPAITCSTRCRVRLHRHPELGVEARWAALGLADFMADVSPTSYVQVAAYKMLFPSTAAALMAGTIDLEHPTRKDVIADEHRDKAVAEFDRLVMQLAAELREHSAD
jgi:hypothetical protein